MDCQMSLLNYMLGLAVLQSCSLEFSIESICAYDYLSLHNRTASPFITLFFIPDRTLVPPMWVYNVLELASTQSN